MDGIRLAALSQRGYAIAARRVGLPHDHYRPHRLHGPLTELSRLGTVSVAFDRTASFNFGGQPRHGEPYREAIVDGLALEHGDYLIAGDLGARRFFVAAPGAVHATLCVACNATLMLRRAAAPEAVGAVGYRAVAVTEEALFEKWPASILQAGRGGMGPAHLPGGLPVGDWTILLPRCSALPAIRNGDVLADVDGRRYGVERAESSALGWRITARTETAA